MAKELNKIQQKAQKKKITILAVMVLVTGGTWSKTLFGKGDKPSPAVDAASATTTAAATTSAAGSPSPAATSTSIANYEQAVARMELWPLVLDRQMHAGTIEELTPINYLLGGDDSEMAQEDQEQLLAPVLETALPVAVEPEVDFEDLHLKLTTTALMGSTRYAIISGTRVTLGQMVEVQVDGESVRYEVKAIGTRIVELSYGDNTHLLRIDLPDLQYRGQDGA